MNKKKSGLARWCEENNIAPGDKVLMRFGAEWDEATITAIGVSAVLARRKGCAEFARSDVEVKILGGGDFED